MRLEQEGTEVTELFRSVNSVSFCSIYRRRSSSYKGHPAVDPFKRTSALFPSGSLWPRDPAAPFAAAASAALFAGRRADFDFVELLADRLLQPGDPVAERGGALEVQDIGRLHQRRPIFSVKQRIS